MSVARFFDEEAGVSGSDDGDSYSDDGSDEGSDLGGFIVDDDESLDECSATKR